jgi:hypothetical protein
VRFGVRADSRAKRLSLLSSSILPAQAQLLLRFHGSKGMGTRVHQRHNLRVVTSTRLRFASLNIRLI